jgi:integrase
MPNVSLDAAFVRSAVCPEGKGKIDYYDSAITGFVLEVRSSGGMTYYLRYRDPHGRQRQQKIGDTKSVSFDKARSAAEKLRSRVVLGESPIEEKKLKRTIPTIAELYFDTYLPYLQSYRRNMQSDLSFHQNHLLPKFGTKHLDELTQQDVIEAQQSMRNAGYAPGTANKYVVQIRYMYNVAKKAKIQGADFNPAAGIKQFTVNGRERFLTQEEIERLRDAVAKSICKPLKYIVALLLMLGCRKTELLTAKWEHVDLERRTWRIPLSKSGKVRHITLSVAAVEILQELPRWKGCLYVVPNPRTRLPLTDIHEPWHTACRRAGLEDVRIHDLRHTFASNLVNAGHSLFVVSRALGHSTTRMSERYAHLSDETLLAAADAAANAMGNTWGHLQKASV